MFSLSHLVMSLSARATRETLGHQLRLLDLVEIDDLDRALAARHQQQPRVIGILDDQHAHSGRSPMSMVSFLSWECSDQAAASGFVVP
jgi:hypothetical protein